MPPVVGIAIAAGASALGVGSAIAGGIATALTAIDATAIIGETTLAIGSDILAGAAVGAAAGAATTAAAGGDPGQGALFGALSGGATAGLTPAVSDVTGLGSQASQAIASGLSTTGTGLAAGEPLGTALSQGATAGVGSYAGSQLVQALNDLGTSAPAPGTTPAGAPSTASTGTTTPAADNSGIERVTVTPQLQSSGFYTPSPIETVVSRGTSPSSNVGGISSVLSSIQQSPVTQSIEKQAPSAALFDLLFGGSGGQQYTQSAGSGVPAGGVPSGTGAAGAAQQAAAGAGGSTSAYAPGGPIFGGGEGGKTQSPWNVASLRTQEGS